MNIKLIISITFIFLILILLKKNKLECFNDKRLTMIKPNNWKKIKFTDKLKIYGSQLDSNYSLYSDKLNVKKYLNNLNINNLHTAKLIKILDQKKNINLNVLPSNCIIKTNHGWSDIIIIKNNKIISMNSRGKKIDSYYDWKKSALSNYITKYEPHYQYIEKQIFIEEYLGDNLFDFKIHCIQGNPVLIQVERNVKKEKCINYYDCNFNILNIKKNFPKCNYKNSKPSNLKEILNISRILSRKFEFVRIDLYNINNKIYFGEFTFIPSGGNSYFMNNKYEYKLSNNWK